MPRYFLAIDFILHKWTNLGPAQIFGISKVAARLFAITLVTSLLYKDQPIWGLDQINVA